MTEADETFDRFQCLKTYAEGLTAPPTALSELQNRLFQSFDICLGVEAYKAFLGLEHDHRRWLAAETALTGGAFTDWTTGEREAVWESALNDVERDVLCAKDAPTSTIKAALNRQIGRHARPEEAETNAEAMKQIVSDAADRIPYDEDSFYFWQSLISTLEHCGFTDLLRVELKRAQASAEPRLRSFAEGRQRVLDARDAPLELSIPTISGDVIDLNDLRGKVVLLEFWASWCGPCVHEIPYLRDAYGKFHDRGFEIIGISRDVVQEGEDLKTAQARVRSFMKDKDMGWPTEFSGENGNSTLVSRFGIVFIPSSLLLDQSGRVVACNLRGDALGAEVDKLLA